MLKMQKLEGITRRALQDWSMVQPHDKLCIAVSGGKDSVALAVALQNISRYHDVPFTVEALTLDMGFGGKMVDFTPLQDFFEERGIKHTVLRTDIGETVFETRKENNPCSLCSSMRRGKLHSHAKTLGCNKLALGHHRDDAVETFYMNLFNEGRLACFAPKSWMDQAGICVIRPFALASEVDILDAAKEHALPVIKNPCPVEGLTARADAKKFVAEQLKQDAAFCKKTIGAMKKANVSGWQPLHQR